MATPRTVPIPSKRTPQPPQNGAYAMPVPQQWEDADADADLLDDAVWDVPNSTKATVYRRKPTPPGMTPGRQSYCGVFSSVTMEQIRDEFGGGEFSVLWTDERGRRVKHRIVQIEGPPKYYGTPVKSEAAPAPQYPVYAPPPMQSQVDPNILAILERVDRLAQTVAALQQQPSSIQRLEEMKVMIETMRSLTPGPAGVDPSEFTKWLRHGVSIGREMESGGVAGGSEEPGWVSALVGAVPQVLEYLDRRAASAARGVTSSVPQRRLAAPPPKPLPTANPNAAVPPSQEDAAQPGLPKWVLNAAREFIRELRDNAEPDPEFMAAWISRHVPARVIQSWAAMPPSEVCAQMMQLKPLVAQGGVVLQQDFINQIVATLFMHEEEPVVASPAVEVGTVDDGSVTVMEAPPVDDAGMTQVIGNVPVHAEGDEDDEDFDDDDFSDDDLDEDDDDDDDFDDDDESDDDDETDDGELEDHAEESGQPQG